MNRRGADLGARRDHPCAAPATTMIELPAVRVSGGGGGRGRAKRPRRGCLTQRYELQGRIHGPAHQRSERALVLSAVGHRREHVFVRLRSGSDGKQRNVRDPEGRKLRIPRRTAKSPSRGCNRSCSGLRIGSADGPSPHRGAAGPGRSGARAAVRDALGDRRDPGRERLHAAGRRPRDVRRRARGRERDHLRAARARTCTRTGRSRSARSTRSRTSRTPRSPTRPARRPTP